MYLQLRVRVNLSSVLPGTDAAVRLVTAAETASMKSTNATQTHVNMEVAALTSSTTILVFVRRDILVRQATWNALANILKCSICCLFTTDNI